MMRCPSDLMLEKHLLGRSAPWVREHVPSCQGCRGRLDAMRQLGNEFRCQVYPATVDQVVEAGRLARPWARWWAALRGVLAPASAIATAAVLALVVAMTGVGSVAGPSPEYVGSKGAPLSLTVFAEAPGGSRLLADGEVVGAGAALRFQIHSSAECRLWILSVDSSGEVSRLYPAIGDGGAEITASGLLPGGAVLDGRDGPERLYAVCSSTPLGFDEVARSVRAAAGGGAEAVRNAGALRGIAGGVTQATVLVEKRGTLAAQ